MQLLAWFWRECWVSHPSRQIRTLWVGGLGPAPTQNISGRGWDSTLFSWKWHFGEMMYSPEKKMKCLGIFFIFHQSLPSLVIGCINLTPPPPHTLPNKQNKTGTQSKTWIKQNVWFVKSCWRTLSWKQYKDNMAYSEFDASKNVSKRGDQRLEEHLFGTFHR